MLHNKNIKYLIVIRVRAISIKVVVILSAGCCVCDYRYTGYATENRRCSNLAERYLS